MAQSPGISVRDLTHIFASRGHSLTALTNINIDVKQGEFVSIIGPSGCGKTTLLKAIGGLLEPTSGQVHINGESPSVAQSQKIMGFVFQDPSLLPWRTVIKNIRLPLEINTGNKSDDNITVDNLLDAVGLSDFRDYYPQELSGGMKQRAALARALVLDPDILLMDEPFGALDEMTRVAMRYELNSLWERSPKTAIFVTHSIAEAVMLSDRVLVMSPRPGHILRDVQIDLPHPRDEAMEKSRQFLEYTYNIKEILSLGVKSGASALEGRIAI